MTISDQTTAIMTAHLRTLIERNGTISPAEAQSVLDMSQVVHCELQRLISSVPAVREKVEEMFPGYEPFPKYPTKENVRDHCAKIMRKRSDWGHAKPVLVLASENKTEIGFDQQEKTTLAREIKT